MKLTTTHRQAFTLIEVLLVILIIGMLAAVLVVTIGGTQEGAKIDTTKLLIQKLDGKLKLYQTHIGHYPTESEGGLKALMVKPNFEDEKAGEKWRGPYAQQQELVDSWGNEIHYEPAEPGQQVAPGVDFKLWSNGKDQQSNTQDDISNLPEETK